jgi:hypothetical protein
MIVLYTAILLVLFLGVIYYGVQLSENIKHPTLIALFWIVYISTVLTVGNIVATAFFYNTLRNKKGLPGEQGRIGDKGGTGTPGKCGVQCDGKACIAYLRDNLNKAYQDTIKALNPKIITKEIKNLFIQNNIKILCNSMPYKEISKYKPVNILNDYIVNIYSDWIKLMINADQSMDKAVIRNFLEIEDPDEPQLEGNAVKEIENYDVFYWGADRIFHPRIIEICNNPSTYKVMPQNKRPKLKALRTNIYDIIWDDDNMRQHDNPFRAGYRRFTQYFSIGRGQIYTFEGNNYYPVGDVLKNIGPLRKDAKYIETFKTSEIKRIDLPSTLGYNGFDQPTLLVCGTDDYIRPPLEWEPIWKSRKKYNLSFWRAKDIYDPKLKKWFRAIGFMAVNTIHINPRQYYGYNNPENQPFRLVAEELLEKIDTNDLRYAWNDTRSGSDWDVSVWLPNHVDYLNEINLPLAYPSLGRPPRLTFYRIKDHVFREQVIDAVSYSDRLTSPDGLGLGYHGAPERDPKYSVFTFINLPIEIQLTNIGLGAKIFVKHSGLNIVNAYMIRQLSLGETELKGAFGKSSDPSERNVYDSYNYNPNNPNLIWEIVCIDASNNPVSDCSSQRYLIKKRGHNQYLKAFIHHTDLDFIKYSLDSLPTNMTEKRSELFEQFVWYNPKSATGNQLITTREIRPTSSPPK